jgi:hypothetical protein
MRRQFILTALACLVGMTVYGGSASAHDRGEYREYRQDWYAAYERRREARERYRADAEARAYERYIAHREYRDYDRDYRSYDGYCDYCRRYRAYRDYGYGRYGRRDYAFSTNPDFADSSDHSYHVREGSDRRWRPDDYPTGWGSWWLRMDREGRAGRN